MLATTWGAILLLTPAAMGGAWHHSPATVGGCATCGADATFVAAQIVVLQSCPKARDRERAAKALRKVDWRCHPEVVEALACALLKDSAAKVRRESAESLAKLAPCLPVAHAALAQAATCDSSLLTRCWARKGLKALGKRCPGDCSICGPAAPAVVVPAPAGEPAGIAPGAPAPATILTPTELRVVPPPSSATPSPFAPTAPAPATTLPPLEGPVRAVGPINYAPALLSEPAPIVAPTPPPPPTPAPY
jgi:hypothetical protein